jgi:eukaryotic-like serine/threonine-protein kinase
MDPCALWRSSHIHNDGSLSARRDGKSRRSTPVNEGGLSDLVREGTVLAGKYRVERVLGAGGMGVVVAAMHMQLRRRVAVKFALPAMAALSGAAERFMREARVVAQLGSEHVARVLDLGTLESGEPFLVMEFLEGRDLAAVIQNQGPLPLDVAVDYILQACDAIAEAHSKGIIHRDLKPQNLFLTHRPGGRPLVKVLDFGIAKMHSGVEEASLTGTGDVLGSPVYMAPEQMRSSRDVSERVDVWALGVILYELITARTPFESDSTPGLCLMITQEPPRPMTELRPGLPFGLTTVVSRCLEKDPTRRFANASELASALSPFAPHPWTRAPASARPPGATGEGRRRIEPAEGTSRRPSSTDRRSSTDTEAPWSDSGARGAQRARRRLAPIVVAIASLASLVVIGGAAFVLRGQLRRFAPSLSTSSQSAQTSVSLPATPPAPLADSLGGPASITTTTSGDMSRDAGAGAGAGAGVGPGPGAVPPGGRHGARPPPRVPLPPRPVSKDDDIPQFRR